jgi:hypothetical protein
MGGRNGETAVAFGFPCGTPLPAGFQCTKKPVFINRAKLQIPLSILMNRIIKGA